MSLWYTAYVRELGYDMPGANHEEAVLDDPMSIGGRLHVARTREGEVVGTVLTNYARDGGLGDYYTVFGIDPQDATSVTTKLVVVPALRRSRLPFRLAEATFIEALENEIAVSFADCQLTNLPLFEKLGYRRVPPDYVHPVFGPSLRVQANFRFDDPLQISERSILGRVRRRFAPNGNAKEVPVESEQ